LVSPCRVKAAGGLGGGTGARKRTHEKPPRNFNQRKHGVHGKVYPERERRAVGSESSEWLNDSKGSTATSYDIIEYFPHPPYPE